MQDDLGDRQIKKIMIAYIRTYVKCDCNSRDTKLEIDPKTNLLMVACNVCGTSR